MLAPRPGLEPGTYGLTGSSFIKKMLALYGLKAIKNWCAINCVIGYFVNLI